MWRLRVFVGTDPSTGNPRQLSRTFRGTREEADTALRNFVAEVVTCSGPPGPSTTVEEYLDRWLDHITPIRSPTTVRGYRFKVRRITAKIGKVQLDQLTAQHLDRIYRQWPEEGLAPSTVDHLHRVLSTALHQAVKRGLVTTAVTDQASPPPRRPPPRELPTPCKSYTG